MAIAVWARIFKMTKYEKILQDNTISSASIRGISYSTLLHNLQTFYMLHVFFFFWSLHFIALTLFRHRFLLAQVASISVD